jgi:hypothetical protein
MTRQKHMIAKDNTLDRKVLAILIALEAVLFCNFYFREIAWYPPLHIDQSGFLTQTYQLEEQVLSKGVGALWKALCSKTNSTGLLLPIEGAFSGLLFGGTRLPQLVILFLAFGILQLVAFATAKAVWASRAYGYMVLGLILCQTTAWFWAGGLFDFRIDFVAYCLYGIWACAVIRSKLFLDRGWAIGSGLIGAFLVLHRFLTAIYLSGVSFGFAMACIVIGLVARRDADRAGQVKQRLYNLVLSVGCLVVVAGPILLANWKAIHDYYVIGHVISPEKYVRASDLGIIDLAGHLLYYPRSVVTDHLGTTFLWGSALAIVTALIAHVLGRRGIPDAQGSTGHDNPVLLQTIFLLGAILGPIVVLTIDVSKSPVVGGVVGVPVTLLVVALTAALIPQALETAPPPKLIASCSLVIFGLGLFNQFQQLSRHIPEYDQRRDLQRLTELDKWLVDYADKRDWHSPAISSDVISEWFSPFPIAASGYEQTRLLLEFRGMLGQAIMGVSRQEALSFLARSDFLILTTLPKSGVYPFYQRVAVYWNDLKAWADKNMILVRTVPFDSFKATIYARPSATISGLSGGWITSEGLSIETERSALQRFPKIRLSGPANTWLPKMPVPFATIDSDPTTEKVVPASFRQVDNSYEILIDTSSVELPQYDNVRLHLKFDTFFVPQHIGINADTRELVVEAPFLVEVLRAGSL